MGNVFILCLILLLGASAFISLKKGIMVYIMYLFLIPSQLIYLELGGKRLDIDLVILFIFVAAYFKEMQYGTIVTESVPTLFKPIFVYHLISLGLILFAFSVPVVSALYVYIKTAILILFAPYIAYQVLKTKSDLDEALKIVTICGYIMSVYAIICFIIGYNPYILGINVLYPSDNVAWYDRFSADERLDFLTGRQQSTISHPQTWLAILSLSLFAQFIIVYIKKLKGKKILINLILIALMVFNLIIGGSRSGLAAFMAGGVVFLIFFSSTKMKLQTVIICAVSFFVFSSLFVVSDQIWSVIESIIYVFDESKQIKGSSGTMRVEQLSGAINIIKYSPVVGMGYGWVASYIVQYGRHPVLLIFESAIFYKLIDGGFLGLGLWFWYFFALIKKCRGLIRRYTKDSIIIGLVVSFIISYLVFLIACGNWFAESSFYLLLVILVKYVCFSIRKGVVRDDVVIKQS